MPSYFKSSPRLEHTNNNELTLSTTVKNHVFILLDMICMTDKRYICFQINSIA